MLTFLAFGPTGGLFVVANDLEKKLPGHSSNQRKGG